jgi:anthranilate synthase
MINYKTISEDLLEGTKEISHCPAHELFLKIYQDYKYKFLLESKDISHIYGRLSLTGIDPVLKITGKNNKFKIEVLNKRGNHYFNQIKEKDLEICDNFKIDKKIITGTIKNKKETLEETKRSQKKNIAQIIRILLDKFKSKERSMLGLYGAFSYDFIRLFEDLPNKNKDNDVNDFTLFLHDTFFFFDHLKEKTSIILFRNSTQEIDKDILTLENKIEINSLKNPNYKISNANFDLSKKEYERLVEKAIKYAEQGEIFEVVFSNILKAKFKGDPLALYLKYRETNPSPYLFYFDFKDEQLVGASPEMMVRVEQNIANLRPISGTNFRGQDPIEDHENMMELLSDEKEKSELDMLIDLGRNDLSRICKSGLKIDDYRFVEKYSRVMHTVAHLSGELKDGYMALDALIACLNAGTLTGAPKVAAMKYIENHEKERRGYYGGTIGYLSFSGEMDTGIVIRTAHIKNNKLRFQVGATLLYNSKPEKEYQETLNKAHAFLDTFANNIK